RASALARADKAMFRATYDVRAQRTDIQTQFQFQPPAEFVKTVEDLMNKAREAMEKGVQAVEATPGLAAADALRNIRARWQAAATRGHGLQDLARAGFKDRDGKIIKPWYDSMADVLNEQAKLSFDLSNAVRMTDPTLAEFVQVRQLAWATRDTAGRECGTARPFIARSQPITPQARDAIQELRSATDATLAQLVNVTDRRGIAPELSQIVAELRDSVPKGKVDRDATYQKLDGSNKPLMAPDEWTVACSRPMERIYQVAWTSFDLMLAHVARVESAAAWR